MMKKFVFTFVKLDYSESRCDQYECPYLHISNKTVPACKLFSKELRYEEDENNQITTVDPIDKCTSSIIARGVSVVLKSNSTEDRDMVKIEVYVSDDNKRCDPSGCDYCYLNKDSKKAVCTLFNVPLKVNGYEVYRCSKCRNSELIQK